MWGNLRVEVQARTTFNKFMKVEYDNERKVKDMTGFCIGVYKKARELLTYALPYELFPSNGTYDELVANVPEVKISYIGPLIFYVFLCNN